MVISATNDFVVVPIAKLFEVDDEHTLATRLEVVDDVYTGKVADKPNFKDGKLYHLKNLINHFESQGIKFDKLIAYSDSKNDIPLLSHADEAICVTPDDTLRAYAKEQGWQVVDWAM